MSRPRRRLIRADAAPERSAAPRRRRRQGTGAERWRSYIGADHRQLGSREILVFLISAAVLSSAAILGVMSAAGWPVVARTAAQADWHLLLLVAIAVILSHVGYVWAYREIVGADEGAQLARREAAALVTSGFGGFVPRGGFALDARGLRDFGLPREEAILRVQALATAEYAVLAPVTLAFALYLMAQGAPTHGGVLPSWAIGVPAGAAIIIGLSLVRRRRSGRPRWWAPLSRQLDAIEMTLNLLRSPGAGLLTTAGMSLYWAGDIAALGLSLKMFGAPVAVATLVVGYATGYALTRRSLPLAGAGAVEGLLPFALVWVSYPLAGSVLAVLAYRVFNLWLMVIPAMIGLNRLRRVEAQGVRPSRLRGAALGRSAGSVRT
jgi:uncharacterized membrane protein YbhN (UPF0104 family)